MKKGYAYILDAELNDSEKIKMKHHRHKQAICNLIMNSPIEELGKIFNTELSIGEIEGHANPNKLKHIVATFK